MSASWFGVRKMLVLILCIIFLNDGTAVKVRCKDRWSNCKYFKRFCSPQAYWRKRCPETCGLCKQGDLCHYQKCPYYSKCTIVGNAAKCLCRNLWQCAKKPRSFVCGSDGVTYKSKCTMKAIACRLKLDIKVASPGFCRFPCSNIRCGVFSKCVAPKGVPQCKCPSAEDCPKIPQPLCGRNGVTYYNHCHWKVNSCRAKTRIPIAKRGRCASKARNGKQRSPSEPKEVSCRTHSCPYYTLCKETDGYPTCVKICPSIECMCPEGTEYRYNLNGCTMCRCEKQNYAAMEARK